jgi:hypothetical protein
MDLIAAGALAAVSIWMLVESLRLPIPGGLATAPGLLPFLTAASLLAMAGVLGANALVRRRTLAPGADRIELPDGFGKTMTLGAILLVYVLGLQFLPLERSLTVGPVRLVIGAFEAVTTVVLTAVLRIYWRQALWLCLALSLAWISLLSVVFRVVFRIQLP